MIEHTDIKYIEVQYLASTGKTNTKITLIDCITRQEALSIADLIIDPSVFTVRCWTNHNTYI